MEKQLNELMNTLNKLGIDKKSEELFINQLKSLGSQMDLKDLYEKLKNIGPDFDLKDLLRLLKKFGLHNECKDLYEKLKNLGLLMNIEEIYHKLKKFGFEIEFKINEDILSSVNREDIMKFLHQNAHLVAPIIERLQDFVETISVPLNFPTKNDVTNVAKLTLQNEEKIDSVLEQLLTLNEYLKKLTSEENQSWSKPAPSNSEESIETVTVQDEDEPTLTNPLPAKEDDEADRKLKKKLLLLDYIQKLSSSPFNRKE